MTVRSTMKSYAKAIQIAFDASASVVFKDSENNAIACNYFSVDSRSTGADDGGFFIAQPSGVYSVELDGVDVANAASAAGHHETAGVGGVIGTADGSVEMSLASTDKTLGITIHNKLVDTDAFGGDNPAIFVVTYGNMKQANPQRDQDNTFYPPGS